MRILFLTRYGALGASSRVRAYQFFAYLKAHGIQVAAQELLDDTYLHRLYAGEPVKKGYLLNRYARRLRALLDARRFDLVWIEKEALPWIPASIERILLAGVPYVVDYDDAVFHTYDRHSSAFVRLVMGRRIDHVMRRAALVTAGNEYLASRAEEAGARRVEILPSVIDMERYVPSLPRERESAFVVGWIGSPGSEVLLEALKHVLAQFTEDSTVELRLIGATGRYLDGVRFETRSWSELAEVDEIQEFDVGIMPLPDTPWTRGKCGYKLIQYMGCALPVVASPVGVNKRIVAHGVNGFLPETPEEWLNALSMLRQDRVAARRMGEAGRERVAAAYSLQVVAPRLLNLLRAATR